MTWALFAETPLQLLPGSCRSRSYEPSDKGVYLIHILINMEPHFLLLMALGEDIIHQALSAAKRFLFTRPTVLFHTLPLALSLSRTLPVPLSGPLPVTSCHFTHKWEHMEEGYCMCERVCLVLYAEGDNVVNKGGYQHKERRQQDAKSFWESPPGRHLLVCVGNRGVDRFGFFYFFFHVWNQMIQKFSSFDAFVWVEWNWVCSSLEFNH